MKTLLSILNCWGTRVGRAPIPGWNAKPPTIRMSSGTDADPAYLDASFDASKLTKPQLRSILGEHGVTELPPTNAKKEVLLALFEERVRARAGEIRRERAAVRASAKGITFLDKQSHPSPKVSPSKSRVASPAVKKSPVRRGRSRSRSASPVKEPLPIAIVDAPVKVKKGRSTGKSKEPRGRSKSAARRSAGPLVSSTPIRELEKALPSRTDSPASATLKLQRRLGYIASVNNMPLAQEAIIYAESPSRMKGISRPGSWGLGRPLRWLGSLAVSLLQLGIVLALTLMAAVYLRWKFVYPLPYCDTGSPAPPMYPEVDLTTSLKSLCLACPDHGTCTRGRLACAEGYIKRSRWLLLGETCTPDWQRFSKAEALVKTIKTVLRERQGAFQCRQCPSPALPDQALRAALTAPRFHRAAWAGPDFDSYYRLAILDIVKDPEHHGLKLMGNEQQRILLSSVAKFSWRCQLYMFAEAHRPQLIFVSCALLAAVYLYLRLKRSVWERRKVDELVQTVLQCLAEQDALNRRDPSRPSTLSVPQLRDALFMNASVGEKARLWPKVCAAIAANANVRESVMAIKGEQHRVWEWIGMDVLTPFTKLQTAELRTAA